MKHSTDDLNLYAPLSGVLVPLEESPDPVFAQGIVGAGVALEPTSEELLAPCAGTVSQLHVAGHAVAVKTDQDVEVLLHIGINTVELKGEGFSPLVKLNQKVKVGQPLIRFDKEQIKTRVDSLQTAILVTTGQTVLVNKPRSQVVAGQEVIARVTSQAASKAASSSTAKPAGPSITLSEQVTLPNPMGLHARPAATLAKIARQYASAIKLTCQDNGLVSSADSITGIMGLQTVLGSKLTIDVTGPDAEAAMADILLNITNGLGEDVTPTAETDDGIAEDEPPLLAVSADESGVLSGSKAAPGIAIGVIFHQSDELPDYPEPGVEVNEELGQLDYGLKRTGQALEALITRMQGEGLATQAEIFKAHLQILDDPALDGRARELIHQGKSAMWAWHRSFEEGADALQKMNNPLLAARAADIRDAGLRVLRQIMGLVRDQQDLPDKAILVLKDITPSEVIALDRRKIIGLCTLDGGSTSHAAILAGSLGIPYLVNVSPAILQYASGTAAILDAGQGNIRMEPEETDIQHCIQQQQLTQEKTAAALKQSHQSATTKDGITIEVAANIGNLEDARKAVEHGADGIGLLRSEFLYLERVNEPSVNEQAQVYQSILAELGKDRPCIIRSLDVGGDKPLAYLPLPKEDNPFLGERGIRIGIKRPALLRKQIRAILQASEAGTPRIMLPMVSSLDEFRVVKSLIREEQELAGVAAIDIGIMIEVPSAAVMADQFAKEVDFFSIGTNDLTQYALAIDRGHPGLAARADSLHPAVLRLIEQTAKAAAKEGKWTGVCGSLASDLAAVPILLGLGITELSVSIPMLPLVKAQVRTLDIKSCQALAQRALQQDSPEAVRNLV